MRLSYFYFITIIMVILALPAMAGEKERKQYFKQLDEDSNQVLDISEVEDNTPLLRDFPKIDKNGDNKLDMTEFSAYEPMERYRPVPPEEPEPGTAPTE